jgi:hypothetical protein
MTLILDTGALLAVERGDRDVMALLKRELEAERVPLTHGGVIGQAWRGGRGRQVNLARLLAATQVDPIDDTMGRRAGTLLAASGSSDVIDAAVALLATDGDDILTSDPSDLKTLVETAGLHVELIPV